MTDSGYEVSETNLYQVDKEIEAVISKTSAATAMEDVERLMAKKSKTSCSEIRLKNLDGFVSKPFFNTDKTAALNTSLF